MKVSKCSEKETSLQQTITRAVASEGVYKRADGEWRNSRLIVIGGGEKRAFLYYAPGVLDIDIAFCNDTPLVKTNETVCFELKQP